ncbi:hypothetical protein JOD28_000588 [Leuconostoc rapi]|nr:hypothetical protein [Leuconostoc rapi]
MIVNCQNVYYLHADKLVTAVFLKSSGAVDEVG